VASLQDQLKRGDKSLVGNKGYRKFLKTLEGPRFAIDEDKVLDEARFDGKWVLQTDTDLPAEKVALKYKELWMVEAAFRSIKSVLETRPIYHKRDETIRGHVFCSFLALMLLKDLQQKMEARGWRLSWERLRRDLDELQEFTPPKAGKDLPDPKPNPRRCRQSPPGRRCSSRTHRPAARRGKRLRGQHPLRKRGNVVPRRKCNVATSSNAGDCEIAL